MTTRTYRYADVVASRIAWTDGGYDGEWTAVRRRAADNGLLYPPSGDRYDPWDVDHPSQRAILIRSIRDTPDVVLACIDGAASWHDVVARLIRTRDAMRRECAARDRAAVHVADPSRDDASRVLADIIRRMDTLTP